MRCERQLGADNIPPLGKRADFCYEVPLSKPLRLTYRGLPLDQIALVEVTSEEASHPVENALLDSVEAGWQAVQPFLDAWKKAGAKGLEKYSAGSEGPAGAEELLKRDGRSWRRPG